MISMAINFLKLYNEFENTKDVCKFCETYKEGDTATRFLLIRSLDKSNLKDIITTYSTDDTSGKFQDLTGKAYNSPVTIDQLLSYIEGKRVNLIKKREDELDGLAEVLADFPIVNCGVRNDKVDDIVKAFVRNKSIKNLRDLEYDLDNSVLPRIRQYSLWSYYNQTSNDIIELFFLKHPSVVPTLRKIHNIDFFVKTKNGLLPIDLKITHISDNYFDLASQGIVHNSNVSLHDDYCIDESSDSSEIKDIKKFYRELQRSHREYELPKMRGLTKQDLCELLMKTNNSEALHFITEMTRNRIKYVTQSSNDLHQLEWWNYKFQGERLFCNNNRFFVFLAYTDRFVDGRELKGKTSQIGQKINHLLDNLTIADIHDVKYHYDKDAGLTGNYTAQALSIIYFE